METLAAKLKNLASEDTAIGRMVTESLRKVTRPGSASKTYRAWKKLSYAQRISQTQTEGVFDLSPCSFLETRPGTIKQYRGKKCVIRWGLTNGNIDYVVIEFLSPRDALLVDKRRMMITIVALTQLG